MGAGAVGSTCAYTLMLKGIFSEIALIDINRNKAEGDALDMNHGLCFTKSVKITAGGYEECADADMIIITAGAAQKQGETRLDLLKRNKVVFEGIIGAIKENAPHHPIMLVVSNPVDILTYVAYRLSGWEKRRVIGSGTVLDTSRLKYMLSLHTGLDAKSIHTYIVGEHGDSEVAAWSQTRIAGLSLDGYCTRGDCGRKTETGLLDDVRSAAYEIIDKKGATYYAIALAVARIAEAIVNDEHTILTVSGVLDGEYGLNGLCLSVPTVVCGGGIDRIIEVPFNGEETDALRKSAETLKNEIEALDLPEKPINAQTARFEFTL